MSEAYARAGWVVTGMRPALAMLLCVVAVPVWSLDWREPWRIPHDAAAAVDASDEFAWRLFVAVIWPAADPSGSADPHAALGADRRCVWERWENSADVYRDDGADPGRWAAVVEPGIATAHRFETLSAATLSNARHIVAGRMEPLRDELDRSRRLVEIRMNRTAFDYLRKTGLYNLDGQIAAVAAGVPVEFPPGSIEVKASWRPIAASERQRYHTLRVRLANGETRLYGLNALNIAAKELPEWFWASFEHIDNASRAGGEGWRLPSRDRYACSGEAADCNRVPSGIGVERTVWEHYRLRGTQTRYLDAAGMPERLGNSELEAGLQETASCMTCHSRSALALEDGGVRRLEVLDPGAADGPPARDAGAVPQRRGYIGLPDPAWFQAAGVDGRALNFQSLDFVWSLIQAKPLHHPDPGAGAPH